MAETKIEWADYSWNAWIGCTKVSPGCKNCYAETFMDQRFRRAKWGQNGTRVKTSDAHWKKPLKWNRDAEQMTMDVCDFNHRIASDPNIALADEPESPRVFVNPDSDFFEDWQGPILDHKGRELFTINGDDYFTESQYPDCRPVTMDDLRADVFRLIDQCQNLDLLLLTKRTENIRRMYLAQHLDGGTTGRIRELMHENESQDVHPYWRHNVWLGCSVENQEQAEKRIPELLKCRDLAGKLFLSVEPLLGPVDLSTYLSCNKGYFATVDSLVCAGKEYHKRPGIDWVIIGGESGPGARPCNVEWIRSIVRQCREAGVKCFVKQLGKHPVWPMIEVQTAVDDFKMAPEWGELRDPKGGDPEEWPEDLRVREMP